MNEKPFTPPQRQWALLIDEINFCAGGISEGKSKKILLESLKNITDQFLEMMETNDKIQIRKTDYLTEYTYKRLTEAVAQSNWIGAEYLKKLIINLENLRGYDPLSSILPEMNFETYNPQTGGEKKQC